MRWKHACSHRGKHSWWTPSDFFGLQTGTEHFILPITVEAIYWNPMIHSFMNCTFNTTHTTTTITTNHSPLQKFTVNERFKQESNQFGSKTTGRPSALSGWLHLQGAEDSALFLCSPAFCLLGVEEGEVEHSHDTTFVTFHTAFLQQGASPL